MNSSNLGDESMAFGPGKYDELCTNVREASGAESVVLMVLGGNKGSGFSVQSKSAVAPELLANLLEYVSRLIREDGRA